MQTLKQRITRLFWGRDVPDPVIDPWQVSDIHLDVEERLLRLEAAHHTTLKERSRIISLQRSQFWAVVVCMVALTTLGAVFGKHLASTQESANSALQKLEVRHAALIDYQIASCKRGNETRASDNRAHLQNYEFDQEIVHLSKVLAAEPQAPTPELNAAQKATNKALGQRLVRNLQRSTNQLEWRYLILNCPEAVAHPSRYKAPPPEKFIVHGKPNLPPASQLHITDEPQKGLIE